VIFYWWMVPVPDPNIDRVHGGYYFLSAGGRYTNFVHIKFKLNSHSKFSLF
jgi:hypothetical protein